MNTWVLLRGLARDSRHWESFPWLLQHALGQDSRVVALDLPGNGRRSTQRSPWTVAAMVDAYRRELDAAGVDRPVRLLGLSLGAMVAIEWACRRPQELASAVLVNGSAGNLSPMTQRMRPAAAGQLLLAACTPRPETRERRILAACTNLADPGIALQRWLQHAGNGTTCAGNALRQLVAAAHFSLPTERPRVPMLVVASTADRVVSVECSVAIARHWSLPIAIHPAAGHEIALDDPAWLVRQCVRWASGRADAI